MIHWANKEANSLGGNSLCSSRQTVDLKNKGLTMWKKNVPGFAWAKPHFARMDNETMLISSFVFNREPMNSWIMKHWLETHNKEEHPDLSITQDNDAFHVLPESRHPPEESIKKMCSPEFFSKHEYKYVKGQVDFGPYKEAYEDPARIYSQACVGKVAISNEDLVSVYARAVNGSMRSRDTKNETLIPPYEKSTTASGIEHQNLVYAEQNTIANETHCNTEVTEIEDHSRMSRNKNGAHKAAIGFKDTNNKRSRKVIPFPNSKIVPPVQKAASNASVDEDNYDIHVGSDEDNNCIIREGCENTRLPSFSIHNEKQTGILLETKYQFPRENRGNQLDLEEKDETQRYKFETNLQEQEGDEKDICGPIVPSTDLEHRENAILEEVNEGMKNAFVEDSVKTKYPSLTIHYKKQTGIPKEKGEQLPIEHGQIQADLTEKDETQRYQSRKTELHHEREGKEEVIYENTKYPSLTIHYKEPSGVPKKTENQLPRE